MNTNSIFAILLLFGTLTSALAARSPIEFEEDHQLPMVYLNIVADAGAASDSLEKVGLSNVAAHMFLRGTKKHSKLELLKLVDRLGASIAVDVRTEGAIFRVAVLAENLPKMLDLLNEIFLEPAFNNEELAKLKNEIIGSILVEKSNDARLVSRNFQKFLFGNHPYGNPITGTQKGVSSIGGDDVRNFYAQHFGQDTLALFGSGDISEKVIQGWWSQFTDKLMNQNPRAMPTHDVRDPIFPKGRRTLIVDKSQATQSQVLLGYRGPRPEMPGYYEVSVANQAYGGASFTATLMKEVREKRGWTYGITNNFRYTKKPNYFATHLFPKNKDTAPAIALTLKLFEDHVHHGITQSSFEFARDSLVNRAPFNYDTPRKRLENTTSEYLYRFPKGFYRDFAAHIEQVQFKDIQPALQNFYDPRDLTLVVVGKASEIRDGLKALPEFSNPVVQDFREDH